jgi:hypothetical protein
VGVAEQLFYAGGSSSERERGGVGVRDNGVGYSWACVKTVWWEKGGPPQGMVPGAGRTMGPKGPGGKGLALEVGIAVVRCANLRAVVSAPIWISLTAGRLASKSRGELPQIPFHHRGMGRQGEADRAILLIGSERTRTPPVTLERTLSGGASTLRKRM